MKDVTKEIKIIWINYFFVNNWICWLGHSQSKHLSIHLQQKYQNKKIIITNYKFFTK